MNFIAKALVIATIFTLTTTGDNALPNQTKASSQQQETTTNQQQSDADYQKVIDEFKKYARTIKPEIKSEISEYRAKIKELNSKKTTLYKELTQEAQAFLNKEKEFKKKLPNNQKRNFTKDSQS